MLKLYSFYITPTQTLREWALITNNPYFMKDVPVLYAWTINKKYASEFKSQRDMSKFIVKEQHISEDEYKDTLRESMQYNQFQLDKIHLNTISDPPFGVKVKVDILGTWYEETSVVIKGDKVWNFYLDTLVDTQILSDEYLVALESLGYMKFYKFFRHDPDKYDNNFYDPYYSLFDNEDGFICDDFKQSHSLNEMAIFLKIFGDTFPSHSKVEDDRL